MVVPDGWPDLRGSAADWTDVTTFQAGAGPLPYPRGRTAGAFVKTYADATVLATPGGKISFVQQGGQSVVKYTSS
jgi:hypothetical protein